MNDSESKLKKPITIRIEKELLVWLDSFSAERGHNRSNYIRYIMNQIKKNVENDNKKRKIMLEL